MLRIQLLAVLILGLLGSAWGRDLPEILEAGVLRHIGIPYANFVTGSGDGLDVELMQGFARELGVRYEYVQSDWPHVIDDMIGRRVRKSASGVELLEAVPVRGDVIANGFTVLDWRKQVVDFSEPTFPSGVWLVTRAESPLAPIVPSGSLPEDIQQVKTRLQGQSLLAMPGTCLDAGLYGLDSVATNAHLDNPIELIPSILRQEADSTLLDVPDALIALTRWSGRIKVIGPISGRQVMGVAFRKDSPRLRQAFNRYLHQIRIDGSYHKLVKKYYPAVFDYYEDFFN